VSRASGRNAAARGLAYYGAHDRSTRLKCSAVRHWACVSTECSK
jgi:hypothetical protein